MCTTKNRVYVCGVDPVTKTAYWSRPDCHLWSCEECAEVNKRRWTAIVAEGIKFYQSEGEETWKFVTITSSGKLTTFSQTLWVWRKAWPKLYARMRREFPGAHYVLLPEKHLDGRLHVHALYGANITTRWLKDNAPYCGLGYKSESQKPLSIELSCFYVLKYISKSLHNGSKWPKSLHRVRTSTKWPKTAKLEKIEGLPTMRAIYPSKFNNWIYDQREEGMTIVNLQTGLIGGEWDEGYS